MDLTAPVRGGATIRRLKDLRTLEVYAGRYFGPVAGVDEAGRGACAGPISIAACVLPSRPVKALEGLIDSKKLTAVRREALYEEITAVALGWSVVLISAAEIDAFGIQHANLSGMRRAVAQLQLRPGYVLIDAMRVPGLGVPSLPIIGGDGAARCIAAASVVAKVTRDRYMERLAQDYPAYGFEVHKGYGTGAHVDAVCHFGATPEHRTSYSNIARAHAKYVNSAAQNRPGCDNCG